MIIAMTNVCPRVLRAPFLASVQVKCTKYAAATRSRGEENQSLALLRHTSPRALSSVSFRVTTVRKFCAMYRADQAGPVKH